MVGGDGGGGGSVKDLGSKSELDELVQCGSPVILHFWASWCEASKQMDQVFSHLATDFPHAHFYRVEAEEQPEISSFYSVSAVPYFVFCKDGKTIDTLEGINPSSLANKVAKVSGSLENASSAASAASFGIAAGPTILEKVKEGAKAVSAEQEKSVGTSEADKAGGFSESTGLSAALSSHLEGLINASPVMLFMKGMPDQPRCGFSRKVVEVLNQEKIKFESFDILSNEEVRQGIKVFSNWSSYPQLYIKGELIGGSDIVLEMQNSGELKKILTEKGITPKESLGDRLKHLISSSAVMLFMKGSPDAPCCGFSSKVVNALKEEGINFGSFDILTDEEVRQGIKTFSSWPTFPQLYYKGELIGGCDIILELHDNGELKSSLTE